jgi:uncharacterized protein
MSDAMTAPGSEMTRPFWDACRAGHLLVPKCNNCGRYFFAPEIACTHCFAIDWKWVPSNGRGTLYSYSIVHRAPLPDMVTPFVFAVIEMEEGWNLFSHLVDCAFEDVRIGMPVEVTFAKVSEHQTLPYFKPSAVVLAGA